jgi:SpoVK/Ycf46/Vps4 family AAA+-type ATPase
VAGYANVKAGVSEVVDPRPDADLDLDQVAAATPGFSGADLANVVNEAAVAEVRPNGSLDPVLLLTKLVNKGVLVSSGLPWPFDEAGRNVLGYDSGDSEPLERAEGQRQAAWRHLRVSALG